MKQTQTEIDPQYLAKLKKSRFSDAQIASRLGTSEEVVAAKWEELQKLGEQLSGSGYDELKQIHEIACLQYQELGRGIGRVGFALSDQVSPEELRGLLEEAGRSPDPVAFMLGHCIILRSFNPTAVEKQMLEYVEAQRTQSPETGTQSGLAGSVS